MNIYILRNEIQQGPLSIEQLRAALATGQLSMSDLGWYEGCAQWTRLHDLPELVKAVLPPPPLQPPPLPMQSSSVALPPEVASKISALKCPQTSSTHSSSDSAHSPSSATIGGVCVIGGAAALAAFGLWMLYDQWESSQSTARLAAHLRETLGVPGAGSGNSSGSFGSFLLRKGHVIGLLSLAVGMMVTWGINLISKGRRRP